MPSVSFITLGCAKNEVDSASMARRLSEAGFRLESDPAKADAVVVNTCSFIQSATEESLEAIFDAADLPNIACGSAKLVVAGCMPSRYGHDLEEELIEARAFIPLDREDDIVALMESLIGKPNAADVLDELLVPGFRFAGEEEGRFAYVKISDGCDRYCAYCTIPFIRGRYHSFGYEDILKEVSALVKRGVREICLIAQDTGRWGQDFAESLSLAWLVGSLAGAFPDTWFRIMYLQPEGVTDDLLDVVASHENICSYFDIPLQHVNPTILKSMHRRGSRSQFEALFERIFSKVPDAVLRTTLIAGFPGETEQQFEELCDFVEEGPFDYVGVFPYSREEGTAAFDLPDQVDDDEKAYRAGQLRQIADAVCSVRIAERIGKTMKVLVEGREEDGQRFGRAYCQAPEVDGVTFVDEGEPGDFLDITIGDTLFYDMESV